jgi:hypothetical protein
MTKERKPYGEGNYEATRDYNERTKRFVDSGQVDQAAHDAAPHDEREAAEMQNAEEQGRERAKEEDPALLRASKQPRRESGTGGRKH